MTYNAEHRSEFYKENKYAARVYSKAYYEKNKAKIIENKRTYREENKEAVRVTHRKHYLKKKAEAAACRLAASEEKKANAVAHERAYQKWYRRKKKAQA